MNRNELMVCYLLSCTSIKVTGQVDLLKQGMDTQEASLKTSWMGRYIKVLRYKMFISVMQQVPC